MPLTTPSTIIGLVDAGGAGGGTVGGSGHWSLIFHLAGWRHPGSRVVVGERRCEMPVREAELRPLMDRVKAYTIVEAEIDNSSTATVTKLRRIVRTGASDPDLEQLAIRLQEPILLHVPTLGRLEYIRRFGEFEGRAEWCGRVVAVSLRCANPDDPAAVLQAAARLFTEQAEWDGRVREYAVGKLLPLKNGSWLEEDEAELSAGTFLSKMTLETISVEESGDFSFWHNDGDLFWGHAIHISGSLSEGVTDADIPG
jgi:hypothetical protein